MKLQSSKDQQILGLQGLKDQQIHRLRFKGPPNSKTAQFKGPTDSYTNRFSGLHSLKNQWIQGAPKFLRTNRFMWLNGSKDQKTCRVKRIQLYKGPIGSLCLHVQRIHKTYTDQEGCMVKKVVTFIIWSSLSANKDNIKQLQSWESL